MFFKTKKQAKSLILLILSLAIIKPLYADLGEANIEPFTVSSPKKSFNAWCGEKNNVCKVSFKSNLLVVNKSSGVEPEQLISWVRNVSYIPRKGIGNAALRKTIHCRLWNGTLGSCRFGDGCNFIHYGIDDVGNGNRCNL